MATSSDERRKAKQRRADSKRLHDPVRRAKMREYQKAYRERNQDDPVWQMKQKAKNRRAEARRPPRERTAQQRAVHAARERRRHQRETRVCQVTGAPACPSLPGLSGAGASSASTVDRCHIKARRYCSKEERNDADNILFLDPRLHNLFDGGRVLVAPNGSLMLDQGLPEPVAAEWRGKRVSGYTPANDRYMAFHRRLCYYHGFEERPHV